MVRITRHAKERMEKYGLDEDTVLQCLNNPDNTVDGYLGRIIAEKSLNGYIVEGIYD